MLHRLQRLFSSVVLAFIVGATFSGSTHAANPGDTVYLCYERTDGTKGSAEAFLTSNANAEDNVLKLKEPVSGSSSNQQNGPAGKEVYAHSSYVVKSRTDCQTAEAPCEESGDCADMGKQVTCRVQKGGVFQNFTVLDEEPCTEIKSACIEVNGEPSCPVTYVWPSGSKTVVEYQDEYLTYPIRINGNKALSPNAIADHTCVLNTKSDNLFCVLEQTANAVTKQLSDEASNDQTSQPKSNGSFSGIKRPVFERLMEWHGDYVVVEDIRIVQKREQKIFDLVAIEADFESVVTVHKPYETACFSANRCYFFVGSEKTRLIKPGTYKIKSSHTFELRGKEVRMVAD